jgi:hypothetical protein
LTIGSPGAFRIIVVRHEYLKVDTTVKTDHATPPLETMQAIRKELAADFSALQLLGSCAVFLILGMNVGYG